jgi:hypothetical protein
MTDTDGLTHQEREDRAKAYYLELDAGKDVLASLELCHLSLAHLGEDPLLWKGVIIGFHSALQGAMAAHLTGTHGTGALMKKDAEHLSAALHAPRQPPGPPPPISYPERTQLADPETLWERMRQEDLRVADTSAGRTIVPTEYQTCAFRKLKARRNELTHFSASGWSMGIADMPKILTELCGILRQIYEGGWAFGLMENPQRERLKHLIEAIPKQLQVYGPWKPRERL